MDQDKIKKQNEAYFSHTKIEWEKTAAICKDYLFSTEMAVLYETFKTTPQRKEIDEFILKIMAVINGVKFFLDKDSKVMLESFGIKSKVIRQLTSLNEIKACIDTINAHSYIYLNPYQAALRIRDFLSFKLIDEIHKNYGFSTHKVGNQTTTVNSTAALFHNKLRSDKRYISQNKTVPLKSNFDIKFQEMLSLNSLKLDSYTLIQKGLKGNVREETLKLLLSSPYSVKLNNSVSKTEYFFTFYPLFRLLMPDDILSVNELENKADTDTRNIRQYFYNDIIKNRFGITE